MIPRPATLSGWLSSPTRLSALPSHTIATLASAYNLDIYDQKRFRIRDGVHTTNAFVVAHSDRRFFLREHLNDSLPDALRFEHALLDFLFERHFPVAPPLRTITGNSYVHTENKYYVLFDFIPGYIYSQYYLGTSARREHVRQAGVALGKYHRLVGEFSPEGRKSWRDHSETIRQLSDFQHLLSENSRDDAFGQFFLTHYSFLADTLGAVSHELESQRDLPRIVIHEDYGPYNIIFSRAKVSAVLDFMDAHLDMRAADLAFSISVFASTRRRRYDPDLMDIFLSAYQANSVILPEEIQTMPYCLCLKRLNELPYYLRAHYSEDPGNPKYETMFRKFVDEIRWLRTHTKGLIAHLMQHLQSRRSIRSRSEGVPAGHLPETPRILTITNAFPFPPDNGTKIPTYYRLRHLSMRNRLTLLCIHSGKIDAAHIEELQKFCCVHLLTRSTLEHPKGTIKKALKYLQSLWNDTPYFLLDGISNEAQMWIRDKVESGHFDVIEAAEQDVFPYIDAEWPVFKVVIFHSVMDACFRRTFTFAESISQKLKTLAYWIVCRRYERKIAATADLCVTLTEQDRRDLLALKADIAVTNSLTNGVDLDYFAFEPIHDEPTGVCFVGRMDYSANVDAVLYFYRDIFPLVRAVHPECRFFIVGSSPAHAVKELAKDPSVLVTGYVHDVRPFLRKAGIAIVPTRTGGGILNKVLEALAMGMPVVTNTRSIDGLSVRSGTDLLVGDTPDDFAQCIIRLFEDPSLRRKLARNGRKYVDTHHRWDTIIHRYEEDLQRQLAAYKRCPR